MARLHTAVLATCFVAAVCGLVAPVAAADAAAAAAGAAVVGVTAPDGVVWYNMTSPDSRPSSPFINVNSGTAIINCAGDSSCYGPIIVQAADNTNVEVRCTGNEACRVVTVNCPQHGGSCTIECTGDNSCRQLAPGYCVAPRCKKICSKTTRWDFCP